MDKNNITVLAQPTQKQEEIELDLLAFLAELLLKWKKILAIMLIGMIIGFGGAKLKSLYLEKKSITVTDEALMDARERIASDRAIMVEQLFYQYVNYKELQEDMRSYYSTFLSGDMNLDNTVQMRSEYYIVSTIRNLDTVFTKIALTEEDYQAMREIASDKNAGATIYDRVAFETAINSNNINVLGEDYNENAYLITVELYGNSEEQCRKLMAIVERAFQREVDKLRILDSKINMKPLGDQYNQNAADYVRDLRKKNIDRMTIAESEIDRLEKKLETLSSIERKYYDLLIQQYNEPFAVKDHHVSWKKWSVIGAFLGVVFATSVIFLDYVVDGDIKSPHELEKNYRLLNCVFIMGKKNLFGRWAARLIHMDEADPTVKADMVATDISIMMEKNGKNSLMLLCNTEDEDAFAFAEQIKVRLLMKNGDLKVKSGNPICSGDELEMAAQADMGVAFAEMKKSKRSMLHEWRQICERYKLPIVGAVAVRRCW